jgi:hypothetical protein
MLKNWQRHASAYSNDILLFGEEQWVVDDTGELIVWQPHQRAIIPMLLTRGGVCVCDTPEICGRLHVEGLTDAGRERMLQTPSHKFPWRVMIWSEPKKSGKSEIEGLVGEWVTLSEPGINEAFFIANDQEQSQGRGYARIGDHLNKQGPSYNPALDGLMRTKLRTRLPNRLDLLEGDFIRAIPADYAGEAGANPTISLWDELWAYTRENLTRLWEEFTIPPTRPNGCKFVATYAGFRDESELLWNLYKRTVRQGRRIHEEYEVYESKEGDTVAFWSHTPRMPWQTPEYYVSEKASLRPNAYRRLHKNQWTRSESAFIDPELWDNLPRTAMPPPTSKAYPVYAAADASHKRDATAGVAVGWHRDGYPFLVRHAIWIPTAREPVIPEDTLGPWLEALCRDFDVRRIGCDPNHMETLLLRMQARGMPAEAFEQTIDNLTRAGDALYTAAKSQMLLLYPASDLDNHVISATAKETAKGWRLSKELARTHIDAAVALAMALALARQHGPTDVDSSPRLFWMGGADNGN